jgi:hypothetical protein
MKKAFLFFALVVFAPFLLFTTAHADLISTFDTGNEGWTILGNDTTTPDWYATGGNPEGHIVDVDATSGTMMFVAPSVWYGNWGSYVGGTITYDVMNSGGTGSAHLLNEFIQIRSGSDYVEAYLGEALPQNLWNTLSVELSWDSFSSNISGYDSTKFANLMTNVTGLWLMGDWQFNYDTTKIDNVMVQSAPIPEPATLLLLGAGLVWLSGARRKLKK